MLRKEILSQALLLTILSIGWTPSAQSGTSAPALDQQPGGVSSSPADVDCGICSGDSQSAADNFVVDAAVTVRKIVLWGFYYPGNTPNSTDHFRIIFHHQSANLPGAVIANMTDVVPSSRIDTGMNYGSSDIYKYVLDLPFPVLLTTGVFWVEIFNDTTGNTDTFEWCPGTNDPFRGASSMARALQAPGSSWFRVSLDQAIQIFGTSIFWDGFESGDTSHWSAASP